MKNLAVHSCLSVALCASSSLASAQTVKEGNIEKCSKPLGTLAVTEGSSDTLSHLRRYSLGSPSIMLRLMVQESGCFTVLERGAALRNMQQERALSGSGMLQEGSNVGGGQMVAADFVMTPAVQFSGDTGGAGGSVGSLLGRIPGVGTVLGGVAGGVKFKEAETNLLVADVRSGIQVASAEGKASKMNFSLGGWGWGGMGWASGGGYTKTPEGKLVAASLLDNYNSIVLKIRDKPSLIQATSQAGAANAAASVQARPINSSGTAATGPAPAVAQAPIAPAPLPAPIQPQIQTQAPVQVARAPVPASAAGFAGNYAGNFIGDDNGSFTFNVMANGSISGIASSAKSGAVNLVGVIAGNGDITVIGSAGITAVNFKGKVENDTLQGQWTMSGGPQGVFIGKRQ